MAWQWCPEGSRTHAHPMPSSVTDTLIANVAATRRSAVSVNQTLTINQTHSISISGVIMRWLNDLHNVYLSLQWGLGEAMNFRSWPLTPVASFLSAMLNGIRTWLPRPVSSSASEGVWDISMFRWWFYVQVAQWRSWSSAPGPQVQSRA